MWDTFYYSEWFQRKIHHMYDQPTAMSKIFTSGNKNGCFQALPENPEKLRLIDWNTLYLGILGIDL